MGEELMAKAAELWSYMSPEKKHHYESEIKNRRVYII